MDTKPLNTEAIALTEKKMDMTLDDIIKMSKTNVTKPKKQRISNRDTNFVSNAAQDKYLKVRRFIDTRASLRQGALAQRRSNFQGNQFPLAIEAARKAAVAPMPNRAYNQSRPFNLNKSRGFQPNQKNVANRGGFIVKKPFQQVNVAATKQNPQTLDSLFANMKMQRKKSFFQQNNGSFSQQNNRSFSQQNNGSRRNGVGQPRVPWARNHIRN